MRAIAALALLGGAACGAAACSSGAGTQPSASASSNVGAKPAPGGPASVSSTPVASSSASATASAPVPARPAFAEAFDTPFDPKRGAPTSIYEGTTQRTGNPGTKRQSGAIVDLPAEFANRGSFGAAGLDAWIDPAPKTLKAMVSFSIVRGGAPLGDEGVDSVCGAIRFRAERWSPGVDVANPKGARVWRGTGEAYGESWQAYAIEAPVGTFRARGCGGWRSSEPGGESSVVHVLTSLRIGEAPPGDLNGL